MLIIAVCDDSDLDRTQICNAIETYLQNQHISGKVVAYDSAEDLHSVIESKKLRFDIVFLDIVMDDMDGMACARLIRQQDKFVSIVFLTSSMDYVYEGYAVNAAAYLLKPINADKLAAVLEKTIDQVETSDQESIAITFGGVIQRIRIKDVVYLESRKNKVELVLAHNGEKLAVYTTLDEFEQLYPLTMWIRVHKSYIVNFLYIEQYASDKFLLRDGTVIPISRSYRDKVRECFFTLLHNE